MSKLRDYNLTSLLVVFAGCVLVGCTPPPARDGRSTPVSEHSVEAEPYRLEEDVFVPVVKIQGLPPIRSADKMNPSDYLGHWLLLNVGEGWSEAFVDEVKTGIVGQGGLERAGVRVLHVSSGVEVVSGVAPLPAVWSGSLDVRSVPARLLVDPKGAVVKQWAGHVDGQEIMAYIHALR